MASIEEQLQPFVVQLWVLTGGPFGSILGVSVFFALVKNLIVTSLGIPGNMELRRRAEGKSTVLREDILFALDDYRRRLDYLIYVAGMLLLGALFLFITLQINFPTLRSDGTRAPVSLIQDVEVFALFVIGLLAAALEIYATRLKDQVRQAMDAREIGS